MARSATSWITLRIEWNLCARDESVSHKRSGAAASSPEPSKPLMRFSARSRGCAGARCPRRPGSSLKTTTTVFETCPPRGRSSRGPSEPSHVTAAMIVQGLISADKWSSMCSGAQKSATSRGDRRTKVGHVPIKGKKAPRAYWHAGPAVAGARDAGQRPGSRWRHRIVVDLVRTVPLPREAVHRQRLPGTFVSQGARSDAVKGFVTLPKRWIVERSIAWLNRCRRLAKGLGNSQLQRSHLRTPRLNPLSCFENSVTQCEVLGRTLKDFSFIVTRLQRNAMRSTTWCRAPRRSAKPT